MISPTRFPVLEILSRDRNCYLRTNGIYTEHKKTLDLILLCYVKKVNFLRKMKEIPRHRMVEFFAILEHEDVARHEIPSQYLFTTITKLNFLRSASLNVILLFSLLFICFAQSAQTVSCHVRRQSISEHFLKLIKIDKNFQTVCFTFIF